MGERETARTEYSALQFVPKREIDRIRGAMTDRFERTALLADIFRINTLYMITRAGSGHIGTSFSAMDIAAWLWLEEMEKPNERGYNPSDIYFSSKGHDVPGLYSILIGMGKLDFEYLHKLRRLGGLPGHPDIGTSPIAANTGSLGMGISKARGMALAKRLKGERGRLYVLTGDGELQEGQIWESLRPAVNGKFGEITVIVDHNKMQSDTWVRLVNDVGDLEARFRSSGWEVARCSGHDLPALHETLLRLKTSTDLPQVLIADTVKGKGVSFMESTSFMDEEGYKFHAGAPVPEDYARALGELRERVNSGLAKMGLAPLEFEHREVPARMQPPTAPERLVDAYGDELLKIGRTDKKIVVLDADLWPDCGIGPWKRELPERFLECGIAEQDMVSVAGGLALQGLLPIVHSFACFLSPRPNEQMYNNATEKTKIIYTGTLAGLIPGGPGHSHQSVRDISALGAMPGLTLIEPANEVEARLAIRWAIGANPESTYLRLVNVPLVLPYRLPPGYALSPGCGVTLREGSDLAFIGYGPVMLREAFRAAELLKERGVSAAVINLPWLNRVDPAWLAKTMAPFPAVVTLDNHYVHQGQGEFVAASLIKAGLRSKLISCGVEEIPACGLNDEVLRHHGMDAEALAARAASLT